MICIFHLSVAAHATAQADGFQTYTSILLGHQATIQQTVVQTVGGVRDRRLWTAVLNNNSNSNCIQRRNLRFFTISSLRRELSPTCTLKWSGCNRVQIMCNTSSTYHVQHVLCATWYEGTAQLLNLTEFKWHLFELYFIGWTINLDSWTGHSMVSCSEPFVGLSVWWLVNILATCRVYLRDGSARAAADVATLRSCRFNLLYHPVTVYWHQTDQS